LIARGTSARFEVLGFVVVATMMTFCFEVCPEALGFGQLLDRNL
jgi:hypothetical protein